MGARAERSANAEVARSWPFASGPQQARATLFLVVSTHNISKDINMLICFEVIAMRSRGADDHARLSGDGMAIEWGTRR